METIFKPIKGKKASVLDKASGAYLDVKVTKIFGRGKLANVKYVTGGKVFEVPTKSLEAPIEADVNERFDYFSELTKLVMFKEVNSLFVSGEGGIGKNFTVESLLESEEFEEGIDYVHIKGHSTPLALFKTLQDNHDKLIVFDDCDAVLKDATSSNILKAVLDTYAVRRVKWLSTRGGDRVFDFTGSAIFLSNMNKEKVDQAILSRSIVIDLFMTAQEKIDRMEHILPGLTVAPDLEKNDRVEVLKLIDKYKYTIENLNLRTLIKGLLVYEKTRNLNIVKYQILNG